MAAERFRGPSHCALYICSINMSHTTCHMTEEVEQHVPNKRVHEGSYKMRRFGKRKIKCETA